MSQSDSSGNRGNKKLRVHLNNRAMLSDDVPNAPEVTWGWEYKGILRCLDRSCVVTFRLCAVDTY